MEREANVIIQRKALDGHVENFVFHDLITSGKLLFNKLVQLYTKLSWLGIANLCGRPFDMHEIFGNFIDIFNLCEEFFPELFSVLNTENIEDIVRLTIKDKDKFIADGPVASTLVIRLESEKNDFDFSQITAGFYLKREDGSVHYIDYVDYLRAFEESEEYIEFARAFVKMVEAEKNGKLFQDFLG